MVSWHLEVSISFFLLPELQFPFKWIQSHFSLDNWIQSCNIYISNLTVTNLHYMPKIRLSAWKSTINASRYLIIVTARFTGDEIKELPCWSVGQHLATHLQIFTEINFHRRLGEIDGKLLNIYLRPENEMLLHNSLPLRSNPSSSSRRLHLSRHRNWFPGGWFFTGFPKFSQLSRWINAFHLIGG